MPAIVFNGKTYRSLEEMPPETRQAYEKMMEILADRDGSGIPDIFEQVRQQGGPPAQIEMQTLETTLGPTQTTIVFNGQTYSSVDEMPPEARRAYEQAMGQFDANRDGIPDFLQGGGFPGMSTPAQAPAPLRPTAPPQQPVQARKSTSLPAGTIEPEGLNLKATLVMVGVLILLILALGAVLFYTFYLVRY